jgi:hypothetical protein
MLGHYWSVAFTLLILLSLVGGQKTQTLTQLMGSIQGSIVTPAQSFVWTISPSAPSTTIQLVFESVSIQAAELRIADSSKQSSGIYLWNCAQCGSSIPPPIYSSTSSVTITMVGVGGIAFLPSAFSLKYVAFPVNYVNIPSNISINLNMGNSEIRPFSSSGRIPPNSIQTWRINQNTKSLLTFMISGFSLMNSCEDSLEIYDNWNINKATVLYSGCNTRLYQPWIYSATGMALVVFKTGASVSTSDFLISYFAKVPLFHCGSFLDPSLLTGASMIVSDGSGEGNLMRRGETCNWNISPLVSGSVSLILSEVSLMFGSSVIIYDSNEPKGTILWNGDGATTTIPPIITSSKKSLFISYASSTSNPVIYKGFYGDFYSNFLGSIGSGRTNSSLMMSSLIDLVPPGDGNQYTTGVNYSWIIQPPVGSMIFTFSELKLANPGDSLVLYDGLEPLDNRLLGIYSGLSLPPTQWFETTEDAALLVYRSASNQNAIGNFKLSYYSDGPNYHCGFIRNPAVMTMSSWTITDGSHSAEGVYPDQHCEWNIQPPNSKGIYIFFNRFNLFNGELLIYLKDVTSTTQLYVRISQTSAVPSPIYIPVSTIGIVYQSTSSAYGRGFSLTYYGVEKDTVVRPSLDSFDGRESYYQIVSFPGNNKVDYVSSIAYSLKKSEMMSNTIYSTTNLTWNIVPSNSKGRIYFAITELLLSACVNGQLSFYDSVSTTNLDVTMGNLLYSLCADNNQYKAVMSPYKWIASTSNNAMIQYTTSNATVGNQVENDFEFSYYSDGNNYHCGFINNPMKLTAPSMIFTDGSSTSQAMSPNSRCDWLIQPEIYGNYNSTIRSLDGQTKKESGDFTTVIEFVSCDLKGGELFIYGKKPTNSLRNYTDTSDDILLWSCVGCSIIPRPILIHSMETIYIKFRTLDLPGSLGDGFLAFYWTTTVEDWRSSSASSSEIDNSLVLELPDKVTIDNSINNYTTAYHFVVNTPNVSQFSFLSSNLPQQTQLVNEKEVFDGRSSVSEEFQSLTTKPHSCGMINVPSQPNDGNKLDEMPIVNLFNRNNFYYHLTQSYSNYLSSSIEKKVIKGYSVNSNQNNDYNQNTSSDFHMSPVCKYWFENEGKQAIMISILELDLTKNGRLRIYSGLTGADSLFYDSNHQKAYPTRNITLPCGKGLILIESMATNKSIPDLVDYGIRFNYQLVAHDRGHACEAYCKELVFLFF